MANGENHAKETVKERVIYTWTNGVHGAVTTQRVFKVLGQKSKSAWQAKVDAGDKERRALLDDLKSIGEKPSKKDIEAIIKKHTKGKTE